MSRTPGKRPTARLDSARFLVFNVLKFKLDWTSTEIELLKVRLTLTDTVVVLLHLEFHKS